MHPRWKTSDEFPGSISLPFGIKTSHTWHEIGQLLRIINDLEIQTFIEIGSHVGGLGSIVSCIERYRPFKYIGVEINYDIVDESMKTHIYNMDALSHENAYALRKRTEGRTMFYCDGGNKVDEMQLYKNHLNTGDVIACHDYFDSQLVVGLDGFGLDNGACGCKPEVWRSQLLFFEDSEYMLLPEYLRSGTRIMGFIKHEN